MEKINGVFTLKIPTLLVYQQWLIHLILIHVLFLYSLVLLRTYDIVCVDILVRVYDCLTLNYNIGVTF